jgi:DNA-directed RNA polymerase subunit RPC12/RpoP
VSAGRIVGIVVSAILFLFGILWLIAATSSSSDNTSPGGRFFVGIILLAAGGGLLYLSVKKPGKQEELKIVQKLELPGDLKLEEFKCSSCGGKLSKDAISVKDGGSIMVTCPYCGSIYQIEEEPKW